MGGSTVLSSSAALGPAHAIGLRFGPETTMRLAPDDIEWLLTGRPLPGTEFPELGFSVPVFGWGGSRQKKRICFIEFSKKTQMSSFPVAHRSLWHFQSATMRKTRSNTFETQRDPTAIEHQSFLYTSFWTSPQSPGAVLELHCGFSEDAKPLTDEDRREIAIQPLRPQSK